MNQKELLRRLTECTNIVMYEVVDYILSEILHAESALSSFLRSTELGE